MAQRIQIRRDTQAAWELANPILAQGEMGWQTDGTATLKMGNATSTWTALPNLLGGGGGGTSLSIPQPQISSTNNTTLSVQFLPWVDNTWRTLNPEIFLMRWSPGPKETRAANSTTIVKGRRWVHPSNSVTPTKWAGWRWFGGLQRLGQGSPATTYTTLPRTTEFDVPPTIKPYFKINIDFNRFMFWKRIENGTITQVDQELIDIPLEDMNLFWRQTQTNKGGSQPVKHHRRRQKFCLVVAIDNPAATQTNGLCPKIFGPMSQPFYTFSASQKPQPIPGAVATGTVHIGTSVDKNRDGIPLFNV